MNVENRPISVSHPTRGSSSERLLTALPASAPSPAFSSPPSATVSAPPSALQCFRSARSGRASGFTLIEVTIALGICATVLIALLGLLPGSLDVMRDAVEITTEARITEELISEIQLADWDEIVEFENEERYYDDQGSDITKDIAGGGNSLLHMYTAQINVIQDDGIRMPGDEEQNEFTRKLTIDIAATRGRGFPTDRRQYNSYATIISRMNEMKQPGG